MKYYTVIATGQTYPVREDLQSWGFFWRESDKAWVREGADEHDTEFFQLKVLNPDHDFKCPWPGVILKLVPEPECELTDAAVDEFKKLLDNGEF